MNDKCILINAIFVSNWNEKFIFHGLMEGDRDLICVEISLVDLLINLN